METSTAKKNIASELLRQMVELKVKMDLLMKDRNDAEWQAADAAFNKYYIEIHRIFDLNK